MGQVREISRNSPNKIQGETTFATKVGKDSSGRSYVVNPESKEKVDVQRKKSFEKGAVSFLASGVGRYSEAIARTYGPGLLAGAITTAGGLAGGPVGAILAAAIVAPLLVPAVIDTTGVAVNSGAKSVVEQGALLVDG